MTTLKQKAAYAEAAVYGNIMTGDRND